MMQLRLTLATLVFASMLVGPVLAGPFRIRCGGCSDPCARTHCGSYADANNRCTLVDPGPVTEYRVVMVPKFETVTRSVCSTEYKDEQFKRAYTFMKKVPVVEERFKTHTDWVSKIETRMLTYNVSVPVKKMKTKRYTTTVPEWSSVKEKYTVKVPVIVEAQQSYKVKVPVLTDVEFDYTVQVPYAETETRLRTVTNAVPVVKLRHVKHCVPVTKTRTVSKDYGHWETRVSETPCRVYQRNAAGCGQWVPSTKAVCQKVWVPNVVDEKVAYVDHEYKTQQIKYLCYEQQSHQVPYTCTYVCYKPETRVGTKKAISYKSEMRTRPIKVVKYEDEQRVRTRKVLSFKEIVRTEEYPVISYRDEERTKEVTYTVKVPEQRLESYTVTRYDCVPEKRIETYTAKVPVPVIKKEEYQICRMVPKVVTVKTYPCGKPSCCK